MTALLTALSTACPAPRMPVSSRLISGLAGSFRRLRAQRQLALLDDRMLRDIGFDRSDIAAGRF